MIKQDTLLKEFFTSNDRFVDLFNAKLFDGENVLKAECCQEMNTGFLTNNESERFVDVARMYKDVGVLGIFLVENQSYVDYSMVVRNLNYMALAYDKQIKVKNRKLNKKDSLGMVYLIVFYTGEKRWDGAKKLSELVDVPKEFKSSFQDFEMNLIEINGESTYTFSNKDVSDLVYMTRSMYDESIYEQEKLEAFNHSTGQVKRLVGKITNSEWLVQNEEEEDVDMCEAEKAWARKIENRGLERGIKQGEARGVEQGTVSKAKQMYTKLINKGKSMEEIADLFDTSVEEVQNTLNYQA